MEITVAIDVLAIDDEDLRVGDSVILRVKSHHTHNNILGLVVLDMPDGKSYTVSGQELKTAADRCLDL